MAVDDTTLIAEVRVITDYPDTLLGHQDLQGVVNLAKRELQADLGSSSIDWYGDLSAERALFWLTCIFCKIRTGELDAPDFSLGELKVNPPGTDFQAGIWFDNFWKHYRNIEGGSPVAHTTSLRSDRTYQFDN
jgi:hypothetical protein